MTGTALKDAALDLLERTRKQVITKARIAFADALLAYGEANADDCHKAFPQGLPRGVNPVCLGAVPKLFLNESAIRANGYITSKRAGAHARPVSSWLLNSADTVERIRAELKSEVQDEIEREQQRGLFE